MPARILVIKLGALGNVVLSFRPFAAIRDHHRDAEITLLTTAPYADWMKRSPWFDRVWIDDRPAWWDARAWLNLRRRLLNGGFDRVYDLQTSARTFRYFQMLPRRWRPEWSGIAAGCSHPDRNPARDTLHDIDRQIGQLRQAGIVEMPEPDLSWCTGCIGRFALPPRVTLLVPGSSAHRPIKRWPVEHYRELAAHLHEHGTHPVVLGSAAEHELARAIQVSTPATDLTGHTTFGDLAALARSAMLAVGNDTGPMHLIAATGSPTLVLFSRDSDPALCAPRGPSVTVLRRPDLATLDAETVSKTAVELLSTSADAA
ncbi:MAG: glycosyltransferase family 9 protein [Acetobacteraceae bacterium]